MTLILSKIKTTRSTASDATAFTPGEIIRTGRT
jgi:hypothetical protein